PSRESDRPLPERGGTASFRSTSGGDLSSRRPRKLGARSTPSFVHCAYRTCATSSGLTQVTGVFFGLPHGIPAREGSSANGRSSVLNASSFSLSSLSVLSLNPVPT